MGIIVSMIYRAIKFYTPRGIGTIFSTYEPDKIGEGQKKLKEAPPTVMKGVLSYMDTEEKIVVNEKYPEQTVIIGKQLPTNFKKKLQDLLRSNANVFAWTHADMTRIPRAIKVGGKPFNTKHKLNEYKLIKPVKQKKRRLGLDSNEATCKQVEELMKAGILRRVKNHLWIANRVMVKKSNGGYHKIEMVEEDKARHLSSDQIGQNLEAYVDDMVIKSTSEEDMLKDIQETFDRFRSVNMKLNPKKCSFGVEEGPFLGPLITKKGIRVNPSKVKAGVEKSLPFFKAREVLVMYLAASTESISVVLLAEREERQVPIYFVSRVLQRVELNYPGLEKLILALVHAARRLQRYFQAHPIRVLTNAPIKKTLTSLEKSGRIAKWTIELGEHDIEFKGHDSIKK
ncbi:reverse transcriptase domain-containing protein [Tanacetum coccineum]|uniref:Reverse transcriptase domain-containing protein n=1 Tax=Tanacetum coccineum TaxID=301880 RepID=A0ABQ5CCF3_9ASTR